MRRHAGAGDGGAESQLAGKGWTLESYWPALQSGDLTLVTALAGYDGMCRPWGFNVFVFVGGKYAGTLSPVNMNARTDGVLDTPNGKAGVTVQTNGTIQAVFTRYASSDPLCCLSRGTTTVTYSLRWMGDQVAANRAAVSDRRWPMPGGRH